MLQKMRLRGHYDFFQNFEKSCTIRLYGAINCQSMIWFSLMVLAVRRDTHFAFIKYVLKELLTKSGHFEKTGPSRNLRSDLKGRS